MLIHGTVGIAIVIVIIIALIIIIIIIIIVVIIIIIIILVIVIVNPFNTPQAERDSSDEEKGMIASEDL